jgi:hypothetical protein
MRRLEADCLPPRHRAGLLRGFLLSPYLGAFVLLMAAGCAATPDSSIEERIAQAEEGLGEDPALRARSEEVRAASAREKDAPLLDELEIRVGGRGGADERVRLLGRIPVANPFVARRQREERRAQTEVALARLEETALEQRAELCSAAVELEVEQEGMALYRDYEGPKQELLEWSEQMRSTGATDRAGAIGFELEQRVEIATREPLSLREEGTYAKGLPTLEPAPGRLVRKRELVHQLVSAHSPSVSVHRAMADRHRRQSQQAKGAGYPSLRFVDVFYDVYDSNSEESNVGGQVAVSIPFGRESRARVERFRALDRSQANEGRGEVLQRTEEAVRALAVIDHFEEKLDRWREISALAREVSAVAQERLQQRLARPSRVASLLDRAYVARRAVLEAREEGGMARCMLLATTGVALEDWPRE